MRRAIVSESGESEGKVMAPSSMTDWVWKFDHHLMVRSWMLGAFDLGGEPALNCQVRRIKGEVFGVFHR